MAVKQRCMAHRHQNAVEDVTILFRSVFIARVVWYRHHSRNQLFAAALSVWFLFYYITFYCHYLFLV